jgi:hypothetical protein
MKTLMVILALAVGTTMGANAQTQAKPKPQTTTTTTSTHAQTQPQGQPAQSQSKSMMKVMELPKPIQENLSKQFKGWTAKDAYKLDSKGVISYEVLVKKEANEMRLLYDKEGKFMKEEPIAAMTPEQKKEVAPAKQETNKAAAPKPTSKPK